MSGVVEKRASLRKQQTSTNTSKQQQQQEQKSTGDMIAAAVATRASSRSSRSMHKFEQQTINSSSSMTSINKQIPQPSQKITTNNPTTPGTAVRSSERRETKPPTQRGQRAAARGVQVGLSLSLSVALCRRESRKLLLLLCRFRLLATHNFESRRLLSARSTGYDGKNISQKCSPTARTRKSLP